MQGSKCLFEPLHMFQSNWLELIYMYVKIIYVNVNYLSIFTVSFPDAHAPTCPVAGQVFSACARPCRNTCDQLKSNVWCKAVCKPGCDCPKGQVIDKRINKCVRTRKCSTRRKRTFYYIIITLYIAMSCFFYYNQL